MNYIQTRPKVVRDNPNIASLDIMKEVGRIWQNIKKEELDYFKEKSRIDMERYKREHERFITEINQLRTISHNESKNSGKINKENEHQKERSLDTRKRQAVFNDLTGVHHNEQNLQSRRRLDEINSSGLSTTAVTPLK